MDFKQHKSQLRSEKLAIRDALDPQARIEMSLAAAEHGGPNVNFDPGTIVSGYLPIRSEIDPRPFLDVLRNRGAQLCLPVVMNKTTIVFREMVRGAELEDCGFGTKGPGPDARELDPQVLIMPLSVFDRKGGRIGYGAGHYDRAIARLIAKGIRPRLHGFAFSCQEVDEVPVEPHDQPLDGVITELGYLLNNGARV